MNLELLEQFGQNYPEEFDGILDSVTHSTVAVFNRRGSVLAVGCNDGRVCIWDFMTRGIAKIIWAHVNAITSVSWSRNGRLLATSSNDCYVCVWDVLTSDCIIQWHFSTIVFSVQFNPRNDTILLIRRMKEPSMLVQYSRGSEGDVQSKCHALIPRDDDNDADVVSSFDRRGEYIYSGNTKDHIQVVQLKPDSIVFTVITTFRVSNTAIKQIEFAPKKKDIFLVNSADRIIRVYNTSHVLATAQTNSSSYSNSNLSRTRKVQANNPASFDSRVHPEPIQKLQDLVNRTTWRKCCFSGGSESDFICAGSNRTNSLYIWDRNVGCLVKILHGSKGETVNEVVWHPIRPAIASIASGFLSLWTQPQVENWSAFAPDFKELEENIEYDERESEFDEMDEDRSPTRIDHDATVEEETVIDVTTLHTIDLFLSSDEEEEDPNALAYFPITVDIDDTENGEENLFEDNLAPSAPHKANNKERFKSDDAIKPLHPKNRNILTVEM